ncbi:hypothetical protein BOTBODRAFT_263949 [Botryobasidium botryosum FD-172 SS1]|uniref:Uncharacterized protein n=1 Tax=Botryobasidium botryosum (strain FD-172 SS1) TaxID=930990 RepID=A0A067LVC7_BOTB1|nr:hypothetical protein BOTBODRAFT_263949 [Botryobasidium botryosum FD-172 SS1]
MRIKDPASVALARYNISVLLCSSAAITIICIAITALKDYWPPLVWLACFSATLFVHTISFFYAAPCWLEMGTATLMTSGSFVSLGTWGYVCGTHCATSGSCDAISIGASLFLWIFMLLHASFWAAHTCILILLARYSRTSRAFWKHTVADTPLSSDSDNLTQVLPIESKPQLMASTRWGRLRKGWTLEESMTRFMFDARKHSRLYDFKLSAVCNESYSQVRHVNSSQPTDKGHRRPRFRTLSAVVYCRADGESIRKQLQSSKADIIFYRRYHDGCGPAESSQRRSD